MTTTLAPTHPVRSRDAATPQPASIVERPTRAGASFVGAAVAYAGRTIRQFIRTPQLLVVNSAISVMFLLIFRYVFGGAIGTGPVRYVDFLIPGLAASGAFFGGTGAAVGVASDVESGTYDRLRSLPISRTAVLVGRSLADTALGVWGLVVTILVGYAVGFRFHGSVADAALAIALCVVFTAAFTWPFIWMGLVAGNEQAANGMGFLAFPLVFVSSLYVPVESMPGWLQGFAEHQPVTLMVDAVRALSLGDDAAAILPHSAGWYAVRAALWCVALAALFAPLAVKRFAR